MVLHDDTSCYDYAAHEISGKRADIPMFELGCGDIGGSQILHSSALISLPSALLYFKTDMSVGPDKLLRNLDKVVHSQPSLRPIDFQYRLQQVIAEFDIVSFSNT